MNEAEMSVINAKYEDMTIPGFLAEFSPEEASAVGAFQEDALSLEEALNSRGDDDVEL